MKIIAQNKKALINFRVEETFEAGLVLMGSEIKSLRLHNSSLDQSFVVENGGELFLHNAYIQEYTPSKHFGHDPLRNRKLLLRRRQINKIMGNILRKGMTCIVLKLYLTEKGLVKASIALATGAQKQDKRQALKEKEWNRSQHRVLKQSHRL